jgi:peroxiredoxin Q/BCP
MNEHPVAPDFELPNVGPGPDRCSLSSLAVEHDVLALFFQRAHDCPHCRKQIRQAATRYESYAARSATPVAVLPTPREEGEDWRADIDPPFPILVDPFHEAAEAYGQSVRLGVLGRLSDYTGRLPKVVVVDARGADPRIVWTHSARSAFDRPTSRDVLDAIDEYLE